MTSAQAGISAARNAYRQYDERAITTNSDRAWDATDTRMTRYYIYDAYYNNTAYSTISGIASTLKAEHDLYHAIRSIYNPVQRLVDWYGVKIYPGRLDTESADSGAIPIITDNDALNDAIIALWEASQWQSEKSLFVRYGAKFGDSFIKVVDDPDEEDVWIEALDPRKVTHAYKNARNEIIECVIEYIQQDLNKRDSNGIPEEYLYSEHWTLDKVTTYRDGEKYAFNTNALGEPVSEWDNDYGFIPVYHCRHRNNGDSFGVNAFFAQHGKIDEVNDLASMVNDGIRKSINFPVVVRNVPPESIKFVANRDGIPILHISGTDVGADPLMPNINVADAIVNINNQLDELENDLPELTLARTNSDNPPTATEVRTNAQAAIDRVLDIAPNYDTTLIAAQKAAVAIGGMRGYAPYRGFNLNSLDNGALNHQIAEREIVDERLSGKQRIDTTMQVVDSVAWRVLLPILGYTEDQIEQIAEEKQAQSNQFLGLSLDGPLNPQAEDIEPEPELETDTPEQQAARAGEAANSPDTVDV